MKTGRILTVAVLFLFVVGLSSAQAVSLSFQPDTMNLTVGDSFGVDIVISGDELANDWWTGGNDLGGFQLIANYDATLLSFGGYSLDNGLGNALGNALGFSSDASQGDLGGGEIDFFVTSLELDLSFQPDFFSIATLSFSALSPGSSHMTLSDIILSDFNGDPFSLDSSGSLSIDITESNVNPVPEPTTMVLLGIGLLGLGAKAKRRRKP